MFFNRSFWYQSKLLNRNHIWFYEAFILAGIVCEHVTLHLHPCLKRWFQWQQPFNCFFKRSLLLNFRTTYFHTRISLFFFLFSLVKQILNKNHRLLPRTWPLWRLCHNRVITIGFEFFAFLRKEVFTVLDQIVLFHSVDIILFPESFAFKLTRWSHPYFWSVFLLQFGKSQIVHSC